jgi:hypothetical protein
LAFLLLVGSVGAQPVSVAWKVAPSDLVRYELREAGKKKGRIVTLHGHDLRDGGQYLPVSPERRDLPILFAFRLPPPESVTRKLDLRKTVPLRVKGQLAAAARDDGTVAVRAIWAFLSRGSGQKRQTHFIRKGRARVDAVFDPKPGHLSRARIEISYTLARLEPKPGEKPQEVRKTYELEFKERKVALYEGLQKDINAAIDRGVQHLKSLQREDGTHPPHGKYDVGTTALALLTLSACGVPRADPALEKGLAWLFDQAPPKNYDRAVALMAVARAYAPPEALARRQPLPESMLPPRRRAWCRHVAARLEAACTSPGAWAYNPVNTRIYLAVPDSSNTQYAVLGLRAAARLGIDVKEQTWVGVIRHFQLVRERKGRRGAVSLVREGEVQPEEHKVAVAGFRYNAGKPHAWASMTCAGIASLVIAREQLQLTRKLSPAAQRKVREMVLGGWAWLDRHWGMDRHPLHPGGRWYYYYLYSLERAAILDRVKRVGDKDWYREGVAQLLARQKEQGSWDDKPPKEITRTCFALLFLKRATLPPVVLTGPGR